MSLASVVVDDGRTDLVAEVERRLREGAREVVIRCEGATIPEGEVLRELQRLRARLRVRVATFDAATEKELGGRTHPREIVRGIVRASEVGIAVEVVLPIGEGLGSAAGRLHGLSRVAPRVARYVLSPFASRGDAMANEIAETQAQARELGVLVVVEDEKTTELVDAMERLASRDFLGALAAFRAAEKGADPRLVARVAPLFASIVGRGPRDASPTPRPPESPRSSAWAKLWAGDTRAARAEAESDPAILGVSLLLERRAAESLPFLDRALAASPEANVALHRVHALLRVGRVRDATRALADLVDGESFGCRVLHALANLKSGPLRGFALRRWVARARASHTLFNGLFATELPALLGERALVEACRSHDALVALLEGLLDRMAGNLGPSPTFVDPARGFVRLELPKISRMAAADALFAIRHGGVEGAERELDRVLAEHPQSVHAHTYRGELELWVGRYDQAMASFARAALIEPTRWAEIGLVAALAATGRTSAARAMAWFASHHFPPVAGGTLPVYRGMLRRLLGDPRAIDDLSTAVAAKPTRVGARIELVLALRAAGRAEEAAPHVAQLFEDAPGLLVSAAEALGVDWTSRHEELGRNDVLEEALRSMRGNRSSAIVTWFDRAGELRVLDSPRLLAEKAARALEDVRGRTRARN